MASVIKIKRSGTSGLPSSLALGEIAYSYLPGAQNNGGDRLYIGVGGETVPGTANGIDVIGGKYFTSKLSHIPGILTANGAIITNSDNKINILNVDNITLNENTISTTNTNGNLVLSPSGVGVVDVSSSRITNLLSPISNTDAANKAYVDTEIQNLANISNLDIAGDSGSGSIVLESEVLTISGGVGLSSSVGGNILTLNLDNTSVSPGSYGSQNSSITLTVDAQGRITSASSSQINIVSSQVSNFQETVEDIIGQSVQGNLSQGISTSYNDTTGVLLISGEDATANTKGVASFNSSNFSVSNGDVTIISLDCGSF